MTTNRMLMIAGVLFLLASLVFIFTDNTTSGGAFAVIGMAMLAISLSRSKSRKDDGE